MATRFSVVRLEVIEKELADYEAALFKDQGEGPIVALPENKKGGPKTAELFNQRKKRL